jgi:hypothetical protein
VLALFSLLEGARARRSRRLEVPNVSLSADVPASAMSRAYDRQIWRKAVRPAVLARDGYRCQALELGRPCGRLAREAGHRIALIDGGEPYQLGNLEAQCRHHNGSDGLAIAKRRARLGQTSRRW